MKKRSLLFGALVAVSLVLTACAGDSSNEDTQQVTEIDPDGTLRYIFPQNPSSFDPHRSVNIWDMHVLRLAYDQLIWLNEEGGHDPMLATGWEFAEDSMSLELDLRDDVTFSDGEPFNAEAVKANLDRAMTLEASSQKGSLARVERVEVLDDFKVLIIFNAPAANMLSLLAERPGSMISPAAFDNPDLDLHPVGTGMATMVEFVPGQVSRWERNENYWDPEAVKAANYEVLIQPTSSTRLNMLTTGQADMGYVLPHDRDAAEAAGLVTQNTRGSSSFMFGVNPSRPPFDDVRVRQAVEHAIDKQGIVDGLFFGAGEITAQHLPSTHWAYNPEINPNDPEYAYNPERAKELLAQAGYPDGVDFDMNVLHLDDHRAIAEAIIPMLEAVGLRPNTQVIETATSGATFYVEQQGDGQAAAHAKVFDPSNTYVSNMPGQFANPWNFTSDAFIEAWNDSLIGATSEDRLEAIHRMIEEEKNLRRFIPIMLQQPPMAYTDKVITPEGYVPDLDPHLRGIGVAKQ